MSLYVCIIICVYIYIYIYTYTHTDTYTYQPISVYLFTSVFLSSGMSPAAAGGDDGHLEAQRCRQGLVNAEGGMSSSKINE